MNNCLPDWNYDCDLPMNSQKKPMGPEHELAELLWRNGQLVLHSQTQRKPIQVQKHDQPTLRASGPYGNSSNLIQDEEAVSWIQYSLEDPFEKEFCSNFFSELPPPSDPMETDKPTKQFEEDKFVKYGASNPPHVIANANSPQQNIKRSVVTEFPGHSMPPPPRFQFPDSAHQNNDLAGLGKVVNFSQFLPPVKSGGGGGGGIGTSSEQYGGKGSGNLMQGEVRECSVMTVGSSYCGSNQVPNDPDLSRASSNGAGTSGLSAGPAKEDVSNIMPQSERGKTETLEPTLTSSSGGSGSSFGRTCRKSTGVNSHKRKGRDAEESECQSEAAEHESAAGNKAAKRSRSSRRSRAAEVHNLSERRRRDRINEKMKALQELIPHCNKTDKASMLDEAIEYLKSLQLQLQVMWMGSGMASMMFPGVQHYFSRMGIGIGPPPMSSIHNPMHLQRVPLVDQSLSMAPSPNQALMCQTPILNPVNIQNQMHNPAFSEQYARYMGFHHMQTPSQPLNVFRFGPHTIPQSQTTAPPGASSGHLNGGSATSNASSGKMG